MAERGSLSEIEAIVNFDGVIERKTWGSLELYSQEVMETYLQWGYIGDIPHEVVPHFQPHCRSKSGKI